jgi:hypothetical protein
MDNEVVRGACGLGAWLVCLGRFRLDGFRLVLDADGPVYEVVSISSVS